MNDRFLIHKETGTVIHADDRRILHYGFDDFVECIVKGDDCFVCGAENGSKSFNNEHVIPKWIMKHYCRPDGFIVLPNGTTIKHIHYTVGCCQDCNNELSEMFEKPVSELLKQGYDFVWNALAKDDTLYVKLFQWVCLLFFKTHLKDSYLFSERDRRLTSGSIADTYCWHPLYHIHSIIRKHHTGAILTEGVQGTILVFEALDEGPDEQFDYLDNLNSQIVMVKVGQVVIFSVLNDSRFCLAGYKTFLSKISGSLNIVQIRELFARLRYLNDNIKKRPRFHSLFKDNQFIIGAKLPKKIEFLSGKREKSSLFNFMRFYIGDLISPDLPERDKYLQDLEEGRAQFIFDENYNFFQHQGFQERKKRMQ
jgi:hypothetical protein